MRKTATQSKLDQQDEIQAERRSSLRTIRKVAPYLWPKGQAWVKWRVSLALVALMLGKLATVATPLLFMAAVDALAPEGTESDGGFLLAIGAIGLVVGYGILRLAAVGFNQLRDAVFARVGQRALRRLALETFLHMHALSLRYHISRKTGALSRIIERGVKGVDFLHGGGLGEF